MSPEVNFYQRLRKTYATASPVCLTPARTERYLEKHQLLSGIGEQLGISNMYFLEAVFYSNNKFDTQKAEELTKSLIILKADYGDNATSYLEPCCIRKDGSINFKKFRRLLKSSDT